MNICSKFNRRKWNKLPKINNLKSCKWNSIRFLSFLSTLYCYTLQNSIYKKFIYFINQTICIYCPVSDSHWYVGIRQHHNHSILIDLTDGESVIEKHTKYDIYTSKHEIYRYIDSTQTVFKLKYIYFLLIHKE